MVAAHSHPGGSSDAVAQQRPPSQVPEPATSPYSPQLATPSRQVLPALHDPAGGGELEAGGVEGRVEAGGVEAYPQ